MIATNALDAILKTLTDSTELAAIVGSNIAYARGAISDTYPLVHFFEVASSVGYKADYNSITVQFSAWADNSYDALQLKEILYTLFNRFHGKIVLTGGTVDINWTTLVDSGALPEGDPQLYGSFLRFKFMYRGTNLGGF